MSSTPLKALQENATDGERTPKQLRLTPKRALQSAKKLFQPFADDEHVISRPSNVRVVASLSEELVWTGDNFTLGEQIGSGSFATVYKATNTTGHTFAIKKIALQTSANKAHIKRHKESLEREINVLKTCRSPYIVSYFGSFTSADGAVCIVMEYLESGTLHDVIKKYNLEGGLDEKSSQGVLRCVLLGLNYLHSEGYVHRDLKTKNMLIDLDGNVKLADFGVSRELLQQEMCRSMVGTPLFMAPEVLSGEHYTSIADVWSYGICVLEVVNGTIPRHGMPVRELMKAVIEQPPPGIKDPSLWAADLPSFVKMCLQKDPKQRASTDLLLKHRWIQECNVDVEATKNTIKNRTLSRASTPRQTPVRKPTAAQALAIQSTCSVALPSPTVIRKAPAPAPAPTPTAAPYEEMPKEEVVQELLRWRQAFLDLAAEKAKGAGSEK